MAEKSCENVACGAHNRKVLTDELNCLMCGNPLKHTSVFGDLAGQMLGENFARDLFGRKGMLDPEAKSVLQEANRIIDRIITKKKVTRGELHRLQHRIKDILKDA